MELVTTDAVKQHFHYNDTLLIHHHIILRDKVSVRLMYPGRPGILSVNLDNENTSPYNDSNAMDYAC